MNVLQVGDAEPDCAPLVVELLETDTAAGAIVADRVVLFAKERAGFGEYISFELPGGKQYKIVVAGVKPGGWRAICPAGEQTVHASAEGCVLAFSGAGGVYELWFGHEG